eukprot:TRINITY_DN47551_c0_g1_i1.p1 TRINITY_DN47551_c0_g1~~TRINITY_DN47551_c0_g1_i1.p1  ORF type:complete len:539 (+),score=86.88 TRINITY_DN47551_c0_g1_i1:175-1791(+)
MINYDETKVWTLLFKCNGSVVPVAFLRAFPSLCLGVGILFAEEYVENFREVSGIAHISQSFMWNAISAVIVILLGFRTRQALGRFWEGTGLLHQMRGEWFDTTSCLIAFSRDSLVTKGKEKEVREFRHTLVRLMSLMHASALDEISAVPDSNRYEVLNIQGLDDETLVFLRECRLCGFNRVEALQHMLQVLVTHNHMTGLLNIPPPILSRIYQTLSRGLVNQLNAKKIKDTMFPFPYSQMILVLLIVHTFFTPIIFTQFVPHKAVCAFLCFLPIFGMHCLNLTAVELEMPFGVDANDLPLRHFQTEMNEALLMLVHKMADHLPHLSENAITEFDQLALFLRENDVVEMGMRHSHSSSFLQDDFFDDEAAVSAAEARKNEFMQRKSVVKPPRATCRSKADDPPPKEPSKEGEIIPPRPESISGGKDFVSIAPSGEWEPVPQALERIGAAVQPVHGHRPGNGTGDPPGASELTNYFSGLVSHCVNSQVAVEHPSNECTGLHVEPGSPCLKGSRDMYAHSLREVQCDGPQASDRTDGSCSF